MSENGVPKVRDARQSYSHGSHRPGCHPLARLWLEGALRVHLAMSRAITQPVNQVFAENLSYAGASQQ